MGLLADVAHMWGGEVAALKPFPSGKTVISLALWCMSSAMWWVSGMNTHVLTGMSM